MAASALLRSCALRSPTRFAGVLHALDYSKRPLDLVQLASRDGQHTTSRSAGRRWLNELCDIDRQRLSKPVKVIDGRIDLPQLQTTQVFLISTEEPRQLLLGQPLKQSDLLNPSANAYAECSLLVYHSAGNYRTAGGAITRPHTPCYQSLTGRIRP